MSGTYWFILKVSFPPSADPQITSFCLISFCWSTSRSGPVQCTDFLFFISSIACISLWLCWILQKSFSFFPSDGTKTNGPFTQASFYVLTRRFLALGRRLVWLNKWLFGYFTIIYYDSPLMLYCVGVIIKFFPAQRCRLCFSTLKLCITYWLILFTSIFFWIVSLVMLLCFFIDYFSFSNCCLRRLTRFFITLTSVSTFLYSIRWFWTESSGFSLRMAL